MILLAFQVLVPHAWIVRVSRAPEECGQMGRDWLGQRYWWSRVVTQCFQVRATGSTWVPVILTPVPGAGEGTGYMARDQEAEQSEAV